MKMWFGYGSEHSMNLVMIGHFDTVHDANDAHKLISKLTDGLDGKLEIGTGDTRFSDEVMSVLTRFNCYTLSPSELEQLYYEVQVKAEGKRIVIQTDELDVSAFLKLLVTSGARVEIFSAHEHPGSGYGRGEGKG